MNILRAMADAGLTRTFGEGRRAIANGGVKVNGELVKDDTLNVKENDVIEFGKRGHVATVPKDTHC